MGLHIRDNAPLVFNNKKWSDSSLTIRVTKKPVRRTNVTLQKQSKVVKAIEAVNGFGYDHCILQLQ